MLNKSIDMSSSYEHVQCLIDELPSSLTDDEKRKAANFIRRYAHAFSKSATDLGRNSMHPHRIDTGDHAPIKQQLRRQPYAHLPEIERNVQELLDAGVIEPASSPWASNVLLVKKKDGSWRFCVDYRRLNDVTKKEAYPLPRIESCLESLGGAKYFSTLDLRAGYWQTALDPRDADKTAFITRSGQYRFTVLSMGLANAPSQFQRLMDLVMAGLLWNVCLVYLDDIIVYSATFEQHLERLSAVFDRLALADLKVKASKCQLFCQEVHFLGHVISAAGVAADPEKVKAVASWPRCRNLTELRSFVGLASYYRRFIARFADIARPLHQLTGKGQPFVWEAAQENAFQTLKERLITAPILASPRDEGEYVLDTDASLYGLGAVLQQKQDGEIRVIAYASRTLSCAERNYSTTRRELLAVIFGFKQFRQFLLGRHFLLRVDHSALTYLRKSTDLIGQSARWLEFIEEFDFRIVHRSGGSHGNCDSMSRRPFDVANHSEVVLGSATPSSDDNLDQWPTAAACGSPRRPVQPTGSMVGDSVSDVETIDTSQD
ncbi:MAG TPA: reverse transcriptase family protein, partial [Methylomicrobium sp.]|nr:reverse transcriptase family protein [Methylomicrobium sp.]